MPMSIPRLSNGPCCLRAKADSERSFTMGKARMQYLGAGPSHLIPLPFLLLQPSAEAKLARVELKKITFAQF